MALRCPGLLDRPLMDSNHRPAAFKDTDQLVDLPRGFGWPHASSDELRTPLAAIAQVGAVHLMAMPPVGLLLLVLGLVPM